MPPEPPAGGQADRIRALEAEVNRLRQLLDQREGAAAEQDGEARFRAIADSIDQMIWSTTADGLHDYFNRRWYDYTGVPAGSTDGEGWSGVFHPDDQDRTWKVWRHSLETGAPYHIEYRLRHRSGDYRWVLGRAQPVRGADGRIVRWYGTCTDIHDLKLAEQKLRTSEERLQTALDAGQIGDYDWDFVTGDIRVSDNLMKVVGLPDDTPVSGGAVFDLIHPDDKEAAEAAVARARAIGEPIDMTYRVIGGDQKIRWITSRGRVVVENGRPRRLIGVNYDVTTVRTAEERLRETEARLRTLTDNLPGVVVYQVVTSRDMSERRYTHVSASAKRVLGVDAEAAMTDPAALMGRIAPAELAGVLAAERQAAATLETLDIEIGGETPRGSLRTRIISRPRALPDGRLCWDGLVIDITERRRKEEEAARTSALLNAIGEATPDLIFAKDRDSRMLYANAAACRTIGIPLERLVGMSNRELARDADEAAAFDANDREVMESGTTRIVEEAFTAPTGERRVYRSAKTVMRDADGVVVGVAGVSTDITDRVEAGERLEQRVAEAVERRAQAEEALRQAQKMETLGQLTGGVAHDFNNLLQIVSGNLDLLQRQLPADAPRLRRAAENAMRGAERAAVLTQRLLAFSRRQPLAPKPVDVNQMVANMTELLHRTLGETFAVETLLAEGVWTVEADQNQLENALLNLSINARDAMADGGTLTISTTNLRLGAGLDPAEMAPGDYVAIAVADTGCGMDRDTAARALEPFFTTKEVGKGTGLGLSMVYGFAKQSGGHLTIESATGEGTAVTIYLPRVQREEIVTDSGHPIEAPATARGETVLVCEDDADVRRFSVEVLSELGYRVLQAQDGPEALAILRRHERVDLLFTDVVLPSGMSGAALAREAQARAPGLKVLFTTGYARNAIDQHGRLDAGVELITKPFSYADLAARMRRILEAP